MSKLNAYHFPESYLIDIIFAAAKIDFLFPSGSRVIECQTAWAIRICSKSSVEEKLLWYVLGKQSRNC